MTKAYSTWHSMLQRCYNDKFHKKYTTYIDCEVCPEWHNYQNFANWFEQNYYEIEGQRTDLDKDILIKGNKVYSSDTCIFVPKSINTLFVKRDNNRGDLPVGVCYNKRDKKYVAQCRVYGKQRYIGYYNTSEEAFQAYKNFKENLIQSTADEYQYQIPEVLYDAMYNYRVEKDD